MNQIEYYLIQKAWDIRRTGEFVDLDVAKLIIRGKIDI